MKGKQIIIKNENTQKASLECLETPKTMVHKRVLGTAFHSMLTKDGSCCLHFVSSFSDRKHGSPELTTASGKKLTPQKYSALANEETFGIHKT